jgi:hypothetical protein
MRNWNMAEYGLLHLVDLLNGSADGWGGEMGYRVERQWIII